EVARPVRRVGELLGGEVEQDWVPSPLLEPEAYAATVGRNGKALFTTLAAKVGLDALLPGQAAPVGSKKPERRIGRTHGDIVAAAQKVRDSILWPAEFAHTPCAGPVPDEDGEGAGSPSVEGATGVEPRPVGRPSH